MTRLLTVLLGRLPIGWLQLTHNRGRLAAAVAGVAFANVLVFVQLGILGALNDSVASTYRAFAADILISASDANTLTEGSNVPRQWQYRALSVDHVSGAAPVFLGNVGWVLEDGTSINLQVMGIDPASANLFAEDWRSKLHALRTQGTALLDESARGLPPDALEQLSANQDFEFELNRLRMKVIGTVTLGGGFSSDGILVVSDQTFLRLFPARSSAAPDHILVATDGTVHPKLVVAALRESLAAEDSRIREVAVAAADDQAFQTTKRPTGLIFGFGVVMGAFVGLIIVFQILSTDVADHLREYATFKAMGYRDGFFIGIVFEEAAVLAVLGFVPGSIVSLLIYTALGSATGLPISMSLGRATAVFVGTLVACIASGALATRRLGASDPAELF